MKANAVSLTHNVIVDLNARTIRPEDPADDDYFGLASGSNGTAAICRRGLVFSTMTPLNGCSLSELRWVRASGRVAIGVTSIPSDRSESYVGPWGA